MKLKILLICLLLSGCSNTLSSSNIISKQDSISQNENLNSSTSSISSIDSLSESSISSSGKTESSSLITSSTTIESSNSFINSSITSDVINTTNSSTISLFNVCEDKPGGKNEDGSDKLPIPCNKDNKIFIGNDNSSMTSFEFIDSLPDNFRAIYGNNFDTGSDLYYASNNGGGFKIKMGGPTEPARGIQTAMFETNLKLEIRINIGAMFNNSQGNKVDKQLPVMVIYAFDEDGNYLRKAEIEEITKNNENGTIKRYIDGSDVAYLEIRAIQCAYKSSQGYNFALLGLDLIAWPYPL